MYELWGERGLLEIKERLFSPKGHTEGSLDLLRF